MNTMYRLSVAGKEVVYCFCKHHTIKAMSNASRACLIAIKIENWPTDNCCCEWRDCKEELFVGPLAEQKPEKQNPEFTDKSLIQKVKHYMLTGEIRYGDKRLDLQEWFKGLIKYRAGHDNLSLFFKQRKK